MSDAERGRAAGETGADNPNEAVGWTGRYVGRLGDDSPPSELTGRDSANDDGTEQPGTSLFPADSAVEAEQPETVDEPASVRRSGTAVLVVAVVGIVLGVGAVFLVNDNSLTDRFRRADETSEPTERADKAASPEAESGDNPDSNSEADGSQEQAAQTTTDARLLLELGRDLSFTAVGTVSDQGTVDAITAAVEATFGAGGRVDIAVDPSIDQPPWLPSITRVIGMMPLLVDGSLELSRDETLLVGRGRAADFDALADGLEPDLGFAPLVVQADVIEGREPWFRASAKDGVLTITGQVPDEQVAMAVRSGAARSYSDESIRDLIELDERTFRRSAILRRGERLGGLSVFEDYVVGLEDNRVYGRFNTGLMFEASSAGLSNQSRRRLNALIPILVGSTTTVTITGHIDTVESGEGRSELGGSRGQAAADYLIEAGVERELVTVADRGDADPVAANDSAEGRAVNRRVEIVLGAGN